MCDWQRAGSRVWRRACPAVAKPLLIAAGTLSGALGTPLGAVTFSRSPSISDSVMGFGDLYPMFSVRWNAGVNNYMTYIAGDIPVGAYDPARLSNIGIGHGAVDGGVGYTYFDPKTGHEFSGVLGFTYNTISVHPVSERRGHAF